MMWARKNAEGVWVEGTPPEWWTDESGKPWDLRSLDRSLLAYHGWQPVTDTAVRPDDTDTQTWDRTVQMVRGRLELVWVPRVWTADELAARQSDAARITSLEGRVAALEALVLDRLPEPSTVPDWDGGPVEPGGHRIILGVEWINSSGAWMTAGPASYPQGWRQATPPVSAPLWAPGQSVQVGDLRSHGGIVYRVIQSHVTQAGWAPPKVPALWTVA